LEWNRVLAPGAILFLILPFAPNTYDRGRAPASAQELLWLHIQEKEEILREANQMRNLVQSTEGGEDCDAERQRVTHAVKSESEIRRSYRAEQYVRGFPPPLAPSEGGAYDEPYGLESLTSSNKSTSILEARQRVLRRAIFRRCRTTSLRAVTKVDSVSAQNQLASAEHSCRNEARAASEKEVIGDDLSKSFEPNADFWRVDESEVVSAEF
jgi:hypothetical protein